MIGERVNHYRLRRKIGAGGMGEVYAAEDTRLDRRVALKILPPEMFSDEERRQRFEREAKAVAALDHPNIVTVHSFEMGAVYPDEKFVHFLTMQLVEGRTLDEVIPEGGLPLDDLFDLAIPLADAVAAAHARGIAHRDLKPSNVMVDDRGSVKVLDFGLAKLLDAGVGDEATHLPTEHVTEEGKVLGTVAYMSPEQAEGKRIDARSDIFSLGVLLYEMATGRRPFAGETKMSLISSILRDEPRSVTELKPRLPRHLGRIVRRCLAKEPERRYQTAIDLRNELDELKREIDSGELAVAEAAGTDSGAPATDASVAGQDVGAPGAMPDAAPETHPAPGRRSNLTRALAGLTAVGILVILGVLVGLEGLSSLLDGGVPAPDARSLSIAPLTSSVKWEWAPTWSPDGSQIAYAHVRGDNSDISVKALGGNPVAVAGGPHDEVTPRWSPDGSKIAFLSDRGTGAMIYWVPPTGGTERRVVNTRMPYFERWEASYALGAQPWSPDGGELVFSRLQPTGEVALFKVDVDTHELTPLTSPEPGSDDLDPSWSFDGESIVFSRVRAGVGSLWLVPADGGEARELLADEHTHNGPAWTPDDRHVVFYSTRSGALNLWEIDVQSGELRQLTTGTGSDFMPVVSRDGRVAYANFSHQLDLYWLPVDTPDEQQRLTFVTGENYGPRVSPDGRWIAYQSDRSGNDEIWILDRERVDRDGNGERQFTSHPAADIVPDWSPDGSRIVFLSDRDGPFQLWVTDVEGGEPRRLVDHAVPMPAEAWARIRLGPRWSPDGRAIGYVAPAEGTPTLWLADPETGETRPTGLSDVLRFDWYLDSSRVVYSRSAGDGGTTEIRVAHLETGQEELLLSGLNAELSVAPDGSSVAYLHAPGHISLNLFRLPLTRPGNPDGLPRPAGDSVQLTLGEGLWHVHGGGWSPGSDAIVYSRDTDSGDIFVIENYR